jgi:hypothetical protein
VLAHLVDAAPRCSGAVLRQPYRSMLVNVLLGSYAPFPVDLAAPYVVDVAASAAVMAGSHLSWWGAKHHGCSHCA